MEQNELKNALIGYTGFVGSNLARDMEFGFRFNSKNIEEISHGRFGTVVCAGVSAVKWLANKYPDEDKSQIDRLIKFLRTIECEKFILLSTVDVYREPDVEAEIELPPTDGLHAYGLNRLYLENFVREKFKQHHVLRLPALFGPGLKKNVIFDLMNSNQLEVINPRSSFQWYPVRRLADAIAVVEKEGLALVNMAAEPIATGVIRDMFFPDAKIGATAAAEAHYNMRTQYDRLFGGDSGYVIRREAILSELGRHLHSRDA